MRSCLDVRERVFKGCVDIDIGDNVLGGGGMG